MKSKRVLSVLLTGAMAAGAMAGGTITASADEKQDLVLNIDVADEAFNADIMEMVKAKFGDKYNLVIKTWANVDEIQNIKTASIAGEQIDLCMYWPNSMVAMADGNGDLMALPLDEYLTDEWKARFSEGALEIGSYDGHVYNLPYSTVYPMMIVNKDLADASGYELSEDGKWTWDDFVEFCTAVSDNTDAFGTAIPSSWMPWLTRNGYMQIWDTVEALDTFCAGETSFFDEKIAALHETVKTAFDNDLFYPGGEASWALENDEVYAALASGKTASMFAVNSMAVSILEDTGLENYKIMDWPSQGPNELEPVLGGCNGYFIPSCAKNVEGAVEVLDYLTSEECATVRAEAGCVSTIAIAEDAKVNAELMADISRCSAQIHNEISSVCPADLSLYMENMPANYFYYGEDAVQEMEDLRLAWKEQ